MSDARERERLNRRIGVIRGTEVGRQLRSYRNGLMRRPPPTGALVQASSVPGEKKNYWHWEDEIRLCHEFLDARNIEPMHA